MSTQADKYQALSWHPETGIDGSTDQCCIAVVNNESALLSGSDQPVRNLWGKTNFQRPPHLHNSIRCIVNIGNGRKLNNNKGKTD